MRLLPEKLDPRYYQMAVLGLLVTCGALFLGIGITFAHGLTLLLATQLTQFLATRATAAATFDPRSAMITALSLTLLLRTDDLALAALAGVLAIGSKFTLRVRGKHVFNPANFAIVTLMLATDGAWISTGQWGNAALGAFAIACLGFLVLTRARRAETTISFLLTFAALLLLRALWLGDPLAIPLHHLQNGALLVFAFFMISDPRSTPDSAIGRVVFGAVVAVAAIVIQFFHYQPFGPMLALFFAAPLTPLIDTLSRGRRYEWHAVSAPSTPQGT